MNVLFSVHILKSNFRGVGNHLELEAQRPREMLYLKKNPKHTQTTVFKVDTEIQNLKKCTAILDHNYHATSNHWPQVLSNSAWDGEESAKESAFTPSSAQMNILMT